MYKTNVEKLLKEIKVLAENATPEQRRKLFQRLSEFKNNIGQQTKSIKECNDQDFLDEK